ncbi:MAG: LysR substrate-binding domain-containing protein, partial [Solirubrobacteraceae bacterium]
PIALLVPDSDPLAKRSSVELADLEDEALVDLPSGWGTRMAVDRAFSAAGAQRTVSFEVNDTASMIEFIRHGLAIGLLPASFVQGLDGVTVVPIRHHAPRFAIAVASPADRRPSAAALALLEAIQHHITP